MQTILSFIGTRPEVIKMAPVLTALSAAGQARSFLCTTGQHVQMVGQMLTVFNLTADHAFTVGEEGEVRSLTELSSRLLPKMGAVLEREKPDLVLVHGDTTTALIGALTAFYNRVPVAHVEAGLRTSEKSSPFPEEANRQMIARLADLHFAPTPAAVDHLHKEHARGKVYLVGNTIVDSITKILAAPRPELDKNLEDWAGRKKLILVTCHRRESWGGVIDKLCATLAKIVTSHPDTAVVWPLHGNPGIADVVKKNLGCQASIRLTDSLPYDVFVRLLRRADVILTDSGGVLEEAATLGRPVLVLRSETERPEALEFGTGMLVGRQMDALTELVLKWLADPPKTAKSGIFGDGFAGEKIAKHALDFLREGGRV